MDPDTLQPDPSDGMMPDPGSFAPPPDQAPSPAPNANAIEAAAAGVHHNRLATALDAIGNLLGGDKTVHLTKHPDGSVEMTHDPSTGSEKWGRIAAAALSGAAKGFSVGQGPGGMGRAAGAGFDAGQQAQKAPQENAQAAVDQSQKDMTFKANHAAMDQAYVRNAEAIREGKIKFAEGEADRYNTIQEKIADAPGSEVLGEFKGVTDLPSFSAKYPQAMKGHVLDPNHYLYFTPTFDASGNQTGSKVTLMNKALGQQIMQDPPPIPTAYYDPETKTIKTKDIKPLPGITYNDWATASKKALIDNGNLALTVDEKLNKQPTNQIELSMAIDKATDPAEKARLQASFDRNQKAELAQKAAGRTVNANPYTPAPGAAKLTPDGEPITGREFGAGDPSSAFERTARMLQSGDTTVSLIKAIRGKGQPTVQDYVGRADQLDRAQGGPGLSPATIEARYQAAKKVETDYSAAGKTGQKIGAFSTLLEHLGDVHDSIEELRQTRSPYLNKPLNALKRDIAGNVNVGPAAIRAAAPASEYARVLSNNQALTKDEKEELPNLLNENQPLSVQQGNSKQMAKTAIDRMDPIFQGYRTTRPGKESPTQLTPRAVQVLRNMGLYDEAMQRLHPNGQVPQAQPNPNAAAAFTPAPKQPTTAPPFPGAVFGTGPQGTGWYPGQTGGH